MRHIFFDGDVANGVANVDRSVAVDAHERLVESIVERRRTVDRIDYIFECLCRNFVCNGFASVSTVERLKLSLNKKIPESDLDDNFFDDSARIIFSFFLLPFERRGHLPKGREPSRRFDVREHEYFDRR